MGMVDFTFFPTSVHTYTIEGYGEEVKLWGDSTPLYNPNLCYTPLLLPMGKRGIRRKQKIIQ